MFMEFYCNVISVLFVLVVYMKVVLEPSTMSDRITVFLDDPQWPEHIEDSNQNKSRDKLLRFC
jgi:hypothetical protein